MTMMVPLRKLSVIGLKCMELFEVRYIDHWQCKYVLPGYYYLNLVVSA
jgi:hypothetical protein